MKPGTRSGVAGHARPEGRGGEFEAPPRGLAIVTNYASPRFWAAYKAVPKDVRNLADRVRRGEHDPRCGALSGHGIAVTVAAAVSADVRTRIGENVNLSIEIEREEDGR